MQFLGTLETVYLDDRTGQKEITMDSKEVFNRIMRCNRFDNKFTDISADDFVEWLTDSRVYLDEHTGEQLVTEDGLEIYDPYVVHTLEYASELICNVGMYVRGLGMLREVVTWLWEDTHVRGYDISYSVLENKLALVMSKLHFLIEYV